MNLFVYPHSVCSDVSAEPGADQNTLHCATVVLQHSDGPVGFHGKDGDEAIKALVHDVVVIERANSPGWFQLKRDAVSSPALHSQFNRVITCSNPPPSVIHELEAVSLNETQAKKNVILARHGKPQLPLSRTVFDDWVAPNGLLRERGAIWMAGCCQTFIVWSFSDWGLYASILARSADEALEPVFRAANELNAPTRLVQSESELPTW
jgi:hypothetical protein